MDNWDCSAASCPVDATLQLIGGKYKAVILWHLMSGELRYSEIHRKFPKVTDKMLTQQLRELERDPILDAMCDWGKSYLRGKKNLPVCDKGE